MKNYDIRGNELLVYMPEKQKLLKIDEGEIKKDHFFISVKNKGTYTLYYETDFGLVRGPKNVNEFKFICGFITFRRQNFWHYGGITDSEQLLGTAVEEMTGVYCKARGELNLIIKQPTLKKFPFVNHYEIEVGVEMIKYKNLKKIGKLLLIERSDGDYLGLEPYHNAARYSQQSFIQLRNGEEQAAVLALKNGTYHKIYEGQNIHNLKNVIIRKDGEETQMLKYNPESEKLEIVARGSWSTLIGVLDEVPGQLDQILHLEAKEWWVKDGYLGTVKSDPEAEAQEPQPKKWSLWKWMGISRYSKP